MVNQSFFKPVPRQSLRKPSKKNYISHCILPGSENERNTILVQGCVQNRRTGDGGCGAQFPELLFHCGTNRSIHNSGGKLSR